MGAPTGEIVVFNELIQLLLYETHKLQNIFPEMLVAW